MKTLLTIRLLSFFVFLSLLFPNKLVALAPSSSFEQSVKVFPASFLRSYLDGKNEWFFVPGRTLPFSYLRINREKRHRVGIQMGLPTNYISQVELSGVRSVSIYDVHALEKDSEKGGRFLLDVVPKLGDAPKLFLKYLNDGRAFRDLNRMFSGVDPRAAKDILALLLKDDGFPFQATPNYQLEPRSLEIEMKVSKTKNEFVRLKVSLPENYYFIEKEIISGQRLNLKKMEHLLGNDQESHALLADLKKKVTDDKWLSDRNLQYNAADDDLYFLESFVTIANDHHTEQSIHLAFELSDNLTYSPKTLAIEQIFTANARYLPKRALLDDTMLEAYQGALTLMKMLMTDTTVLAGIPNYMTYFGRDTLYTSLILFDYLTDEARRHFLQQVLNRASRYGECAHEIDTRYDRYDERHYDYRMADSDLIFSFSLLNYAVGFDGKEDAFATFLNHKDALNRFDLSNGAMMARNLEFVINKFETEELLGLKTENDPSSGNWRDALNSLGRGEYPYDINCVWPQKVIFMLGRLRENKALVSLLKKHIDKSSKLYSALFDNSYYDSLKEKWEKVPSRFEMTITLNDWRQRLKRYYSDADRDSWKDHLLHNMPIGFSKSGSVLTAFEFIYENKVPVRLPNGDSFPRQWTTYSLCLDRNADVTDVVHSDLDLAILFFDETYYQSLSSEKYAQLASLLTPYTLPLSLGGLGVYNRENDFLGFSVANPMLSKQDGYALGRTSQEIADHIDGKRLSSWELLNKNSYHGMGAVWSFQKDFYAIARNKLAISMSASFFKQLFSREESVRPEILTVADTELDFSLVYKNQIQGLTINPCQLWNIAIIPVIHDWFSTVLGERDQLYMPFESNPKQIDTLSYHHFINVSA